MNVDLAAAGSSGGGDALQATYRRIGLDSDSEDAAELPRKQKKGRGTGSRKPHGDARGRQQQAAGDGRAQERGQRVAAAVEDVEAARVDAPGLDLRLSAGAFTSCK